MQCRIKLHRFYICCAILFCILFIICSYAFPMSTAHDHSKGQKLHLYVKAEDDTSFVNISAEDIGEGYTNGITYYGCSEVKIDLSGKNSDLISAIQESLITPEEIVAYAQIDARNGFCKMKYQSKLGYAHYAYCYDDFEIVSTYDIFEAPDGSLYPLNELFIGISGFYENTTFGTPFVEQNGQLISLAREDWGITFEVIGATPSGITIRYNLGNGQYLGDLCIIEFELLSVQNSDKRELYVRQDNGKVKTPISINLTQGTGEFTIDWSSGYGKISEGQHSIRLYIRDIYKEIPDLMKNYLDEQSYEILFSTSD